MSVKLNVKQPHISTSHDDAGRIVYRVRLDVYDAQTGRVLSECSATGSDIVKAGLQAADQAMNFMKDYDENKEGIS
jgi:hypothetical protein